MNFFRVAQACLLALRSRPEAAARRGGQRASAAGMAQRYLLLLGAAMAPMALLAPSGLISAAMARDDVPKDDRAAARAPLVSVVTVDRAPLVQSVVATGSLIPRDEILVAPEIDGQQVIAVLVEEGDRVEKGQVLAQLSAELINRQIAQQQAVVARAAAAIPQAQSNIAQAQAANTEAQLAYERASTLLKGGNTTAAVMEGRVATLRQTEGRLAHARSGLAAAEAELAQARAMLAELELRLARTQIRAPEAGVVSRRSVRLGMNVASGGEPLFRLIARGEIEFEGEVLETALPQIRADAPATVEAGGQSFSGTVRAVYPEVDRATRLGKVRVRLPADPHLRIGSFATGRIELARSDGVAAPVKAVAFSGAGEGRVLVVQDGVVRERAVRTGITEGDQVEIREGLAPGDIVVAQAGSFLRDGDAVRVRQTHSPDPAPAVKSAAREQQPDRRSTSH